MKHPEKRLDLLAANEVAEALKETDAVIVPVGAMEPHGRHAPMGSDTFIAAEIADRLAGKSGALVFPALPLGNINIGYDFRYLPGTISLDPKLLIDLYTNLGTELARSGLRRLVFVNGHTPNASILNIASFAIREKSGMEVGILDWWSAAPGEIEAIKGFNFGSHADEIETSVIMASLDAQFVDLDVAEINSRTLDEVTPSELALYKAKVPFTRTLDKRWIGQWGNMGDPTRATEANGNLIIDKTVEVGIELLSVLARQLELRAAASGRLGAP